MIAQSRKFSNAPSSLLSGFRLLCLKLECAELLSVTVICILPRLSDVAYLFSLLRMGDGVTKNSRNDVHMLADRFGNLTASLPMACKQYVINQQERTKHQHIYKFIVTMLMTFTSETTSSNKLLHTACLFLNSFLLFICNVNIFQNIFRLFIRMQILFLAPHSGDQSGFSDKQSTTEVYYW